jgi:hypothetical protein
VDGKRQPVHPLDQWDRLLPGGRHCGGYLPLQLREGPLVLSAPRCLAGMRVLVGFARRVRIQLAHAALDELARSLRSPSTFGARAVTISFENVLPQPASSLLPSLLFILAGRLRRGAVPLARFSFFVIHDVRLLYRLDLLARLPFRLGCAPAELFYPAPKSACP